ncbi:MAG: hypothetical protein KGY61_10450 [Desulfobacterales bacterium]|nr:hypothetical protein [Desulfobacterales bacterium]
MSPFDKHIEQIRRLLEKHQAAGRIAEHAHAGEIDWPRSNRRSLVLANDTGVELGHPRDASTAFLLWTNNPGSVSDNRITVIGPELPEIAGRRAAFGKIVIVEGEDFNETNSFERYREMELLRYDIDLSGYMMRGVSQYQREWSRISRDALRNGFSFKLLGGALLEKFAALPYIKAAEIIFITQGREAVLEAKTIADGAIKIIGAMNKMAETLSFDCSTCEYRDVCADVAELRSMRKALIHNKAATHA